MKNYSFILVVILAFPIIVFSQKNKPVDSSAYYRKRILKTYKQAIDSVENTVLYTNYIHYQQRENNYHAQTFFVNALHSNYNTFNDNIVQNGFSKMTPLSYGFGFGYSGKYEHIISDFGVSLLFPNNAKKGDETISSGLFNILFDFGYDVLKLNNLSVYPYAGLSARVATLNYVKKGTVNPQYSNITDLLVQSENTNAASLRLGYQAGLGIDVALMHNKENNRGLLIFVKAGVNQPFSKDKFKIHNTSYNPEINKGDWMLSVGVKFMSRKMEMQ